MNRIPRFLAFILREREREERERERERDRIGGGPKASLFLCSGMRGVTSMSLLARLAWREAQVLSSSPLRHLALNLNLNLNVHQHLPSPSLFVSLPLTRHYAQTTTTNNNNNNNNNTNFLSGTLSRMRPQSQWDLRPLKEREGRRKENGFINVAEAEGAKAKARARANQVVGEVSKVEGLLHPKAMLCSANYLFGVKPAFDEPCEIEQVEEVERNAWKDSLIVPGKKKDHKRGGEREREKK